MTIIFDMRSRNFSACAGNAKRRTPHPLPKKWQEMKEAGVGHRALRREAAMLIVGELVKEMATVVVCCQPANQERAHDELCAESRVALVVTSPALPAQKSWALADVVAGS